MTLALIAGRMFPWPFEDAGGTKTNSPPMTTSEALNSVKGIAIGFAVALCIGISVYATLNDRFGNDRRPRELKLYGGLDKLFSQIRQQQTPIFLKFGKLSGKDIGFASTVYFRSIFDMFPVPVLVGDPSDPIFFVEDILRINLDHGDDWLAGRHVGIALSVRLSNGKLLMTPRRVPAPVLETPQGPGLSGHTNSP
jgi:hypothetical protein